MSAAQPEYVLVRYDKMRHIRIQLQSAGAETLHEHGALELGLVLEGRIQLRCGAERLILSAGEPFLINPYEPHWLSACENVPNQVLSLWVSHNFGREYFAGIANTVFALRTVTELPEVSLSKLRQLMLDAAEYYFREERLECVGTVSHLLALLLQTVPHKLSTDAQKTVRRKRTGRMQRIAVYLDQHYKERITLAQLADAEGLTPAYMSRVFTELFGVSFQEYLNLLRMEQAISLLRDPSMYLTDICMECGFSDTRYLNAAFSKAFGCSAVEYRKKWAEEDALATVQELREKRRQF